MSDIDILRDMLTDSMQLTVVEALSGKKQVTLIENTPPVYYEVNINNIPENVDLIVIKTEAFLDPNKGCQVFKGSKGERKRADFAIVAETNNEKLIIFIEMKNSTTTSTKSDITKQFYGAQSFIHYCQIVGQLFWEVPNFLKIINFVLLELLHKKNLSAKEIVVLSKKKLMMHQNEC